MFMIFDCLAALAVMLHLHMKETHAIDRVEIFDVVAFLAADTEDVWTAVALACRYVPHNYPS